MRKLLILFGIVLAGCFSPTGRSSQDILLQILREYTYVEDSVDDWQSYSSVRQTMTGDCEDAVTLFLGMVYEETGDKLIAGIYISDEGRHAAAIVPWVDWPITPYNPGWKMEGYTLESEYSYDQWMAWVAVK